MVLAYLGWAAQPCFLILHDLQPSLQFRWDVQNPPWAGKLYNTLGAMLPLLTWIMRLSLTMISLVREGSIAPRVLNNYSLEWVLGKKCSHFDSQTDPHNPIPNLKNPQVLKVLALWYLQQIYEPLSYFLIQTGLLHTQNFSSYHWIIYFP